MESARVLTLGAAGLVTAFPPRVAASMFGRMFAMPPRDTTYFTPNEKFYIVNYSDSPFSVSRDLNADQWQLAITGAVRKNTVLRYGDILKRPSVDQAVTLQCIDNLPGADSMGRHVRGISLKALLEECAPTRHRLDVVSPRRRL